MKTIVCRQCGAAVDADLGVCPVCGAIFYIIREDEANQAPPRPGEKADLDKTAVWKGMPEAVNAASRQHGEVRSTAADPAGRDPGKGRSSAGRGGSGGRRPPAGGGPEAGKRPPQRRRGLDNRTKALILGVTAVLAVLAVVICVMSGALNFHKEEEKVMPTLTGYTAEAAQGLLEDMGVTVKLNYAESEEPKNTVINQSVEAGKTLPRKPSVTLTISLGQSASTDGESESRDAEKEYITVPDLRQLSFATARSMMEALGVNLVQTGEEYSDSVEKGLIISQSPVGEGRVLKGDTVSVVVSKGPEALTITVTAGKGGDISPNGLVKVDKGGSARFAMIPDEGYKVSRVLVDGADMGELESYTFENVTENHTIYAVFILAPQEEEEPVEPVTPEPDMPEDPGTPAGSGEQPGETETPQPVEEAGGQ